MAAALLALLTTALGLSHPSPAMASTWSYDLINTSVTTDGKAVPLVRLPVLSLTAGANKFLNASYVVRNPQAFNIMQGARVRCQRKSDGTVYTSVFTTRNVTANGTSTARVHWLFTAPSTDDYTCTLWGHAATSVGTTYHLTVTSGALGVDDSVFPDGAEWRDTTGGTVASGGAAYLLRKTWVSTTGTYVGANVGVEMTDNYGSPSNGASSVADVTLYITQLRADGTGCVTPFTSTQHITISANVHHDKVYLSARGVPISTAAGCTRSFAIKVLADSLSGNPLVLEGGADIQYSNGIAFSY
jgi:hypothetical protein